MKKLLLTVLILTAIVFAISCTNKEGDSDLDVITPTDSTQGHLQPKAIPNL